MNAANNDLLARGRAAAASLIKARSAVAAAGGDVCKARSASKALLRASIEAADVEREMVRRGLRAW